MLEVTTRSATDIFGIQPNSAALFYRKIREVIVYQLEQESHEIFHGLVELDETTLVVFVRVSVVAVLRVRFIRELLKIPRQKR